jgi:DNA-binding helix-hairpin-helix protein with protein kinase domain
MRNTILTQRNDCGSVPKSRASQQGLHCHACGRSRVGQLDKEDNRMLLNSSNVPMTRNRSNGAVHAKRQLAARDCNTKAANRRNMIVDHRHRQHLHLMDDDDNDGDIIMSCHSHVHDIVCQIDGSLTKYRL